MKQEVTNWSDVQSLLEYVIEVDLHINIREHPVLLTEIGLTSKKQREKLTEVCDTLNYPPVPNKNTALIQ